MATAPLVTGAAAANAAVGPLPFNAVSDRVGSTSLVVLPDLVDGGLRYRLAWEVPVVCGGLNWVAHVDAINGSVLRRVNDRSDFSVPATFAVYPERK